MEHTSKGKLYTDIVLEVFRLSGAMVTEGDGLVKELGLTSARWKVLGALAIAGEPLTVARIAHTMGQTRQNVQRLADAMAAEGILYYFDNPYHKKAKLVYMTEKGIDLYSKADRIQIDWSNRLSGEMDEGELASALKVLKSMGDGLKA